MKRKVPEAHDNKPVQEYGDMTLRGAYHTLTAPPENPDECSPQDPTGNPMFRLYVEVLDNAPQLMDRYNIVLPQEGRGNNVSYMLHDQHRSIGVQ